MTSLIANTVRLVVLLTSLGLMGASPGFAQGPVKAGAANYPNKPVRLIVPFPAGGGTDVVARIIAREMSDNMGIPIVIDNRGGAAGIIATEIAGKSTPDGYTLLFGNTATNATHAAIYRKLPYDPIKDFAAISLAAFSPYIMSVNPSVPARSVKEFVALAKAKPGQLNFGSGGNGSVPHLAAALFNYLAGINVVHVPYKGGAAHLPALVAGEVQVNFSSAVQVMPLVKAHKLRALAVTGTARLPSAPELPTVAEAGVPGYEFGIWWGFLAPAGTPRATVDHLYREVVKALQSPQVKEKFGSMGVDIIGNKPDEFAAVIRRDVALWKKIAVAAGIKLDY